MRSISAAVFATLAALTLIKGPARAELDPTFLEGCRQAAMGLDDEKEVLYCTCVDRQIRSAKLGPEGSLEFMLALVSARDPASLQNVTPENPETAKIMMTFVTETAQICAMAAMQGKVQPDGSVKD
jgi:hypothetical protein